MIETNSTVDKDTHRIRWEYLDLVKCVAIFLVIWGHVLCRLDVDLSSGHYVNDFIYSFHMPLFMMLSGMFVRSSVRLSFSEMWVKKFRQLIVPAVSCTALSCLYFFMVRDGYNYRDEIIGNSWFLKTLFVCYLLFWLVQRLPLPDYGRFLLSCALLFIFPHAYSLQVNRLFPFFWGGYFYMKHHDFLCRHIQRITVLSVAVFVGLYAYRLSCGFPYYVRIDLEQLANMPDKILLNFSIALSGSVAMIGTCKMMAQRHTLPPPVCQIGRLTLGIYTMQTIVLVNPFQDIITSDVDNWWLLNVVLAPLVSVLILWVCVWLIRVSSAHKRLDRILFGGAYYALFNKGK